MVRALICVTCRTLWRLVPAQPDLGRKPVFPTAIRNKLSLNALVGTVILLSPSSLSREKMKLIEEGQFLYTPAEIKALLSLRTEVVYRDDPQFQGEVIFDIMDTAHNRWLDRKKKRERWERMRRGYSY